jgi:hypothetical protein
MQEADSIARGGEAGGVCVVRCAGRFRLVRTAGGFVWTFTDEAGACWYWNTRACWWTGHPQPSPTEAEAAGFGSADPADPAVQADDLEEARCYSPDILDHLRGPGPHVRGRRAARLLLSKQ